jgi:hypothetical protein
MIPNGTATRAHWRRLTALPPGCSRSRYRRTPSGSPLREIQSWSDKQIYQLGRGLRRSGWSINVPDLTLFPDFFGARSVMFRAGMELAVLNRALSVLVALYRIGFARDRHWQVPLSAMLMPFGTDRGGMAVYVTGTKEGQPARRCWHLIAEAGEGPFVPGVAVRALLRRAQRIPPGARPCLVEATLGEIEEAMSDLAIKTQRTEEARPTLFQVALADRWNDLPPAVRRLHSVQDMESFSGRAWVERGTGAIARLAAGFSTFPMLVTMFPSRSPRRVRHVEKSGSGASTGGFSGLT